MSPSGSVMSTMLALASQALATISDTTGVSLPYSFMPRSSMTGSSILIASGPRDFTDCRPMPLLSVFADVVLHVTPQAPHWRRPASSGPHRRAAGSHTHARAQRQGMRPAGFLHAAVRPWLPAARPIPVQRLECWTGRCLPCGAQAARYGDGRHLKLGAIRSGRRGEAERRDGTRWRGGCEERSKGGGEEKGAALQRCRARGGRAGAACRRMRASGKEQ